MRCQLTPAHGRIFNTSLIFDSNGRLLSRYRKVHRFDADLPGAVSVQESRWFAAGEDAAAIATPLGILGTAICYDLRFPELFRGMSSAGAEVIVVPAAFTAVTGRDHWEVLLRARAIENQCYVVAPNQCGHPPNAFAMHGHSAIVDPWGQIVAMASDTNGDRNGRNNCLRHDRSGATRKKFASNCRHCGIAASDAGTREKISPTDCLTTGRLSGQWPHGPRPLKRRTAFCSGRMRAATCVAVKRYLRMGGDD